MNLVTQIKTHHFSRQTDGNFLDFLCQILVVQLFERVLLLEHEIGHDHRDFFRHQIGQVESFTSSSLMTSSLSEIRQATLPFIVNTFSLSS